MTPLEYRNAVIVSTFDALFRHEIARQRKARIMFYIIAILGMAASLAFDGWVIYVTSGGGGAW